MFRDLLQHQPRVWRQTGQTQQVLATPSPRRPVASCAAAPDVPDTSKRRNAKRANTGRRQRSRAPLQPHAPPPIDRNAADNLFLDPGQFDLQGQLNLMQEAFSQMSDSERQSFLDYLASQEGQAATEAFAQLSPEQRKAALDDGGAPNAASVRNKLQVKLWRLTLDSLPDSDAAILKKALPRGWYGARDLSRREVVEGLGRLTRAERRRLPLVLERVAEVQQSADEVAKAQEQHERLTTLRRQRLAAQKGLRLPDVYDEEYFEEYGDADDAEGGEAGGGEGRAAAGNLTELLGVVQRRLRQRLREVEADPVVDEKESLQQLADHPLHRVRLGPADLGDMYDDIYDRQQQPGATTSGGSGGGGNVIPEALQGRLGRMAASYDTYVAGRGWEQEAMRRESVEMRNLVRLHAELTELAAAAAAPVRGGGGMPLSSRAVAQRELDLQRRSDDLASQVAALLQPGARQRLQDPAARAVVRYIETQLVAADEGDGEGAAAEEDGGLALEVDEQALARLSQLMTAATNWEGYRAFMDLYANRHPELSLGSVMRAAGMSDGDEWWAQLPDLDTNSDGHDGSSSDSAGGARLVVDWSRVEAVAALDGDCLAFLTELEASGYSEGTFMKWYFHPVLGPRIRAGSLLDASGGAAGAGGPEGAAARGLGSLDPAALLVRLMGAEQGEVPPMVREAMEEAVKPGSGPAPDGPAGAGAGAGGERGVWSRRRGGADRA